MNKLEEARKLWPGKSDEWLYERLANELTSKVEEIHRLVNRPEKKYMIVRTLSVVAEFKDEDAPLLENCFQMVEKDFTTPEAAHETKESYRYPQHYIVVPYWD